MSSLPASHSHRSEKRGKRARVLRLETFEDRRVLADISAPAILQWFESSYDTIEQRTADVFMAGYGSVWTPPPGRADISDFSVGYDVYDRFDLGRPGRPTLFGTETGIKTLAEQLHRAAIDYHVDFIMNHAGFSNQGTPGFYDAGGYPGFFLNFFGDPDGDFNSAYSYGDVQGRLAGLVDINHSKNYRAVRNPVPGVANNIQAGTVPLFGRLANLPDENNRRFYPDIGHNPIFVFDPVTGESNIPVYQFNLENPLAGDPTEENALGYIMRNAQWLVQVVGVDGLRLDAAKHVEGFVLDFIDRAVYRQNPRNLLDGSPKNVFTYSEVYDASPAVLLPHVKKTINPADPGRIGGNRDTLDFKLYFALKENLEHMGQANAWQAIRNAALDVSDDGLHNGSAGVLFVNNHDVFKPFELGNVAHAYVLMQPGNAVVYFNGKEFGDNRDFPKEGRDDALSVGTNGEAGLIATLVDIRNTHGRGDYAERWIDNEGLFSFERVSSAITLLSNRGDSGFDSRTLTNVGFAPGTHLIELTGNAADGFVDPYNDLPEVVTVFEEGGVNKVNVRFPRNKNANGDYHGKGYAIYGLPTPQALNGLEVTNVAGILPGDATPASAYENGRQRQTDVAVINANSFGVRLLTNEVRLLGSDSLRDIFADGDNAMLKVDGGRDVNGNGFVDFTLPGSTSYGFETFGDKSNPLIGPTGLGGPRGDGEFLQTIDTSQLEEGYHYLTARAFRHRTDGGPAVFSDFKKVVYVDRLKPVSAVASFNPFTAGVNENRDLVIRSVDQTANNVHVFLDLPAGLTEAEILAQVGSGNKAAEFDRDLFKYGFLGLQHGNHVATVVTYEPTGNVNVQRIAGLFTDTIVGAGLGDLTADGLFSVNDVNLFGSVLASDGLQFNPAADFNGDGLVNYIDLIQFRDKLQLVSAGSDVITAWQNLQQTVFAARDDAYSVGESGPLTIAALGVLGNDVVPAGVNRTLNTVGTFATQLGGQFTMSADGGFSYQPPVALEQLAAGAMQEDSFLYYVGDGFGNTSAARVAIQVQGENDPLAITFLESSISENGGLATGTVSRSSSDNSVSVTVNLTSSDPAKLSVPNQVLIPAGQASATFSASGVDDSLFTGDLSVTVTAAGTGLTSANRGIIVADYETLALSFGLSSVRENTGSVTATISRSNTNIGTSLTVSLSSTDTSEATVPAQVLIPAGQTSATFLVTGVSDDLTDGSQLATIQAAAAGYQSGSAHVTVLDDDLSWRNSPLQYDVNNDGDEDITDLLALVFYFNSGGVGPIPEGPPTLFYDVTGDRTFDIRDILSMVYYYNTVIVLRGAGEGEAEPPMNREPAAPLDNPLVESELLDLLAWQFVGQRKKKG